MRRFAVVIALMVWTALALPTATSAELPRTVEEQAEFIADTWAAWLWDDCGDALAPETIAGPREELVEGLKARLEAPLNSEQYAMVSGCMMGSVDGYTPIMLPLELELRRDVRVNLYHLDYYLAHPRPDPRIRRQVGVQVAEVFYLLQQELIAELAPRTEDPEAAAKTIAGSIFWDGHQLVLGNLMSRTTPVFKRPFTEDEMARLRARVSAIVQPCGQRLEQDLGEHPTSGSPFVQAVYVETQAGPAASSLASELQGVFWGERPPMLSPREQQLLDEAMAARMAAQTIIMTPQGQVDAKTGELLRPRGDMGRGTRRPGGE